MKFIKNSMINLFPYILGSNCSSSILLLIAFSVNGFAQIYVSDDTAISVIEGTFFHAIDENAEVSATSSQKERVKIYITQNTQVTNLLTDSLVEIVYLESENQPKRSKQIAQQKKKISKPLQSPMVKKDTPSERKSVLSFVSGGKSPSALLYSGKTTRAAILNSGNFIVKLFPPKKTNNNIIHTFFLNDNNQKMETSFAGILPKPQNHLERKITRPPPLFLS